MTYHVAISTDDVSGKLTHRPGCSPEPRGTLQAARAAHGFIPSRMLWAALGCNLSMQGVAVRKGKMIIAISLSVMAEAMDLYGTLQR